MASASAGMGDAVTGINRADPASEKSNGPMLRQLHAGCNSSHGCGRFRLPWLAGRFFRAVSTADSGYRRGEPDGVPTAARVFGAMWRPWQIFLCEGWPVVRKRNIYRNLVRASVHVLPAKT